MGGGVLRFRNLKMGEICQTAGQIGTKFYTYMRIHLGTNRLKNNYPLETPGGILRGLCGQTASLIAGCVCPSKPHYK